MAARRGEIDYGARETRHQKVHRFGEEMKKPELIIFDLGRVLLDFDFMKVVRGLQKHSPHSSQEIRHYFKTTPHWDRFERGVMNEKTFFKSLSTDLKLNGLHYEAFMPLW